MPLSLTKADIIDIVARETGFPRFKSARNVNQLLEIIKRALASGDDVLISGFGKFCIRDKSVRRGRNPVTGDDMMLPAKRVVTFKCSGKLRNRCNAGKGKSGN